MSWKCLIGLHDWKRVAAWTVDAYGRRLPRGVKSVKGLRTTKAEIYKCKRCGKTKKLFFAKKGRPPIKPKWMEVR
ncbi:hypothetical protein ES703_00061 [subsurface metagenome]